MTESEFMLHQTRRAQTEGRIGICKYNFFDAALSAKGFEARAHGVAWGILSHNLWVLARLPRQSEKNISEERLAG
jgi:hypothetical protein